MPRFAGGYARGEVKIAFRVRPGLISRNAGKGRRRLECRAVGPATAGTHLRRYEAGAAGR